MHTFYYPAGHVWMRTASVGELVAALQKLPQDAPILTTWEGMIQPIKPFDIVSDVVDGMTCYVINADYTGHGADNWENL